MSKLIVGAPGNDEATQQTCLQCYRKTVAPLLLKCQHFICISCLKEQLMLTKGGLYNEYKCKVCGLFTDLSHLSRVFIDNQSFNMFEPEELGPPPESAAYRGIGKSALAGSQLIKSKGKSQSKKRIEVTTANVANLNEKADELISTLQVNKKIIGETAIRSSKEALNSQYLDPIDYSKCIKHQKELIFLDRESIEFYCVECITDPSLKLDTSKLAKIKRENLLIKEESRKAVAQLSAVHSKLDHNLKQLYENESTCKKLIKEIKQVSQNQFSQIYSELKLLEIRYEEWVTHTLEMEAQECKNTQGRYLEILGMVSGTKSNFNQIENFSDIISNICRWKRVSREYNLRNEKNKPINTSLEHRTE